MKWLFRAIIAALIGAAARKKMSENQDITESPDIKTKPPEPHIEPVLPRKAFDISNYWLNFLPTMSTAVKLLADIRDLGYSGVMIGVWRGAMEVAHLQYDAARHVGLWTDTFSYMYFDDEDFVRLDVCMELPGGICWIDCEFRGDDETNAINEMTNAEVRWHIWRRVEYVKALGMVPGIYTQKSWWVPYTGNETYFAEQGIQLWDANELKYDPYGGWAAPLWTQNQWDQRLNGVLVDLSIEGPL